LITFARRLCLFICWFVSRITQTFTGGFGWSFQGRLDLFQLVIVWFWLLLLS